MLKLTPEVKAEIFDLLSGHYDAIILETFGIGGIPEYKSDDMTTESIVAKLMWILGQTDKQDEIARLFYREINHDRV